MLFRRTPPILGDAAAAVLLGWVATTRSHGAMGSHRKEFSTFHEIAGEVPAGAVRPADVIEHWGQPGDPHAAMWCRWERMPDLFPDPESAWAWKQMGQSGRGVSHHIVNHHVAGEASLLPPGDEKTNPKAYCRHPHCRHTNWQGTDRLHLRSVDCPPLMCPHPAHRPGGHLHKWVEGCPLRWPLI